MHVELVYFKPSGKYYTGGTYETASTEWYAILGEIRALLDAGKLPDLVEGARYDTLVMMSPPHLLRVAEAR